MAIGTQDFGRGETPETTEKKEGFVERTIEFIAHPSRDRTGKVTHADDAVLGYDPAEIPEMVPATVKPDPGTDPPVDAAPVEDPDAKTAKK